MELPAEDTIYFSFDSLDIIEDYLRQCQLIGDDETVTSITKPGDGNMNFTARVRTDRRSLILKQAKPFVEKYPRIAAPAERAIIEAHFYELTGGHDSIRAHMPKLLYADRQNYALVLEDVGPGGAYAFLYAAPRDLTRAEIAQLLSFLECLHDDFNADDVDVPILNREMRSLNAEHLFQVPLADTPALDLDQLTPGLSDLAAEVRGNADVMAQVSQLEQRYLAEGKTLLHGDYFPGAWLKTCDGIRIIDPEFTFHGPQEFDVGVMIAHLYITGQSASVIERVEAWSETRAGSSPRLVQQFAGIEIIRRLLGVAQLPLAAGLARKRSLLQTAMALLTTEYSGG